MARYAFVWVILGALVMSALLVRLIGVQGSSTNAMPVKVIHQVNH